MRLLNLFEMMLFALWVSNVTAGNTTFHDITPGDLPELNKLMRSSKKAASKRYTEEYMDQFMELLSFTPEVLKKSKAKKLLVEGELAGFYSFYVNKDGFLELDNFFLAPQFLFKGYGKFLWEESLRTAREYGEQAHFIIWSSLEACTFYLKRGCIKIGEKPSPVDESLMQPLFTYSLIAVDDKSKN